MATVLASADHIVATTTTEVILQSKLEFMNEKVSSINEMENEQSESKQRLPGSVEAIYRKNGTSSVAMKMIKEKKCFRAENVRIGTRTVTVREAKHKDPLFLVNI